ncbi:MAG: 4'-phosphopantetheinyl transferase [Oscillibacter sp.]|nr:4'-phosphopantetheinyl transferase [Oscillibacter sp.]
MRTVLFAARLTRELSVSERETLFSCLPPERQARFLGGKARSGRAEILCAYGLLCAALYRELGWRVLPEVSLTAAGKPFFPQRPDVCFSLSHTEGAVMAGLSPAPIGVDIEKTRPVRPRLMKRVADTENPESFFRRWVALEAVGKRDGGGVLPVLRGTLSPLSDPDCRLLDTWPGYFAGAAFSPGHALSETRFYTV